MSFMSPIKTCINALSEARLPPAKMKHISAFPFLLFQKINYKWIELQILLHMIKVRKPGVVYLFTFFVVAHIKQIFDI